MERNDKILDSFGWRCIRAIAAVPLICIYSSPTDYPGKYVARLWDMMRPTNLVTVSDSLEGIRQTIPDGMMLCPRYPNDDNCIVETWI